jgi:hypothetical protein
LLQFGQNPVEVLPGLPAPLVQPGRRCLHGLLTLAAEPVQFLPQLLVDRLPLPDRVLLQLPQPLDLLVEGLLAQQQSLAGRQEPVGVGLADRLDQLLLARFLGQRGGKTSQFGSRESLLALLLLDEGEELDQDFSLVPLRAFPNLSAAFLRGFPLPGSSAFRGDRVLRGLAVRLVQEPAGTKVIEDCRGRFTAPGDGLAVEVGAARLDSLVQGLKEGQAHGQSP